MAPEPNRYNVYCKQLFARVTWEEYHAHLDILTIPRHERTELQQDLFQRVSRIVDDVGNLYTMDQLLAIVEDSYQT